MEIQFKIKEAEQKNCNLKLEIKQKCSQGNFSDTDFISRPSV